MSQDENSVAKRKIHEQCMLLHYMGAESRSATQKETGLKDLNESCKYTSFIPINGPPTEMMSILTGRTDIAGIMDLTPYQLSFLVPKIRLFKTYIGEEADKKYKGKTWDVEMLFADNISGIIAGDKQEMSENRLKKMLSSRASRGTGVGIKGFSWKYEGTNPAEAANLLTANLSIQFSDVSELFEKRGPFEAATLPIEDPDRPEIKKDCYFQYVDLIMRTAETGRRELPPGWEEKEEWCKWMWLYNPEHFELKAVVGWELKEGAPFTPTQVQILRSASAILYLTIVDHVIHYNEDGTMALDIRYRAAMESILEEANTDLFISTFERTRQAQIEAMRRAIVSGRDQTVTSSGNIQGETDSFGTSNPPPPGNPAAEQDDNNDKELANKLEDHLNEMRALTRNMGYLILQAWIADETHIQTLELADRASHEGRKFAEDPIDYAKGEAPGIGGSSGGPQYSGNNATSPFYGAPWPLSYGSPHGATFDNSAGNFDGGGGLARVKHIFVKPSWLGAQDDGPIGNSMILAMPPFWQTNANDRETNGILDELKNTGQGSPGSLREGGGSENQSTMGQAMTDNASPSQIGGAQTDFKSLLQSAVDARLYYKKTFASLERDHSEYMKKLGDNTYPLRFIYYGDILDWAIRKALWRPPYTPDQAYVTLDTFAAMSDIAKSASGLYTGWQELEGLDKWDKARAKVAGGNTEDKGIVGPNGKRITINDFVDDLKNLKERKYDKINIVLGCVEYFDPVAMKNVYVNLADIPISLNRWNEWFIQRVQRPGVWSYNLRQFIKDTLNSLVLDVLAGRGCYQDRQYAKQIFDIGISNFTLPAYKKSDGSYMNPAAFLTTKEHYINPDAEIPNYRVDLNKIRASLDKRSLFEVNEENTDVYHFIAIYARGYDSTTLLGMESDEEAKAATEPGGWLANNPNYQDAELPGDLSRGIFHFYMGHNQGLVKSIKFSRTDQKYLAEARILGQGHFGYNQLRGRYEATIVMQGNCFFLPGQFIYINPRSVGSGDEGSEYEDAALLLGLGGYYVVLDIESTITPEFYETQLRCVWHGSGRPDVCDLSGDDQENNRSLGATFTQEQALSFAASVAGKDEPTP